MRIRIGKTTWGIIATLFYIPMLFSWIFPAAILGFMMFSGNTHEWKENVRNAFDLSMALSVLFSFLSLGGITKEVVRKGLRHVFVKTFSHLSFVVFTQLILNLAGKAPVLRIFPRLCEFIVHRIQQN